LKENYHKAIVHGIKSSFSLVTNSINKDALAKADLSQKCH
jgi:hypothetical protein